jgi:hypothetical protein
MLQSFQFVEDFPAPGTYATSFPVRAEGGFVYVLCWVDNDREIPFYVGETGRLNERMGDYCTKQFGAATDFRVGEAICYLREAKGFRIVVRYKPSSLQKTDRRKDEYLIVRGFQTSGVRLLNDLVSYNYKEADQQDEKRAVHSFCEVLIRAAR